jgi:MFS family permease
MNVRQFLTQLAAVTAIIGVLLWLLTLIPVFRTYQLFSWLSTVLFIAISIGMFFSGRWATKQPNKNLFISLMYVYMGGKMLLSILLITLYYLYVEPTSKLFILPFFVVYFSYTIFESYFLMKLNKKN